ncbi:MAG: uncharacterized protein A8A55_1501 [Amphiamblys sp. WSBS2006]|nr:MAG: uncharacterized protein A8A55_1501 [Amphiamblys sp. WSBS2006]
MKIGSEEQEIVRYGMIQARQKLLGDVLEECRTLRKTVMWRGTVVVGRHVFGNVLMALCEKGACLEFAPDKVFLFPRRYTESVVCVGDVAHVQISFRLCTNKWLCMVLRRFPPQLYMKWMRQKKVEKEGSTGRKILPKDTHSKIPGEHGDGAAQNSIKIQDIICEREIKQRLSRMPEKDEERLVCEEMKVWDIGKEKKNFAYRRRNW